MGKENPVLVLASGDDPQFAMLNELPHTIMWRGCRMCAGEEGRDCNSAMVGHAGIAARIVCEVPEGALGTLVGRGRGQPFVSRTRA